MKCKTGLFLIGLIIVFLLINAATDPKRGTREERDTEPEQQKQHNKDQLKCSQSSVTEAAGQDVILDFHFEPELDVTQRSIEWNFNNKSTHVLVYKSRGFSEIDQHEQFRGRASLNSSGNLNEGKLPLKISKVTTDDTGTYICSVRNKEEIISCSTELIIDSEENRNKGNQTDSDQKTESNNNNNNWNHDFITLGILVITILVIFAIGIDTWTRFVNHYHCAAPDGRRPQEEHELDLMADQHAGQDEVEPQEENERALMAGNVQPDSPVRQRQVSPTEEA